MTATVRGISVDSRDGQEGAEREREFSITYLVNTDSWQDGPQTVIDAPGLPVIGDVYAPGNDSDDYAIVHSKRASQREAPDEWEVEVTYRTAAGDTPFGTPGGTAVDKAPTLSLSTAHRNVMISGIYSDPYNAKPEGAFDMGVHMSNGEHCDPPPEIEIAEPVLSISRNVRTVDWPFIMSVCDAVNSVPFFGCYARQLKLSTPKVELAADTSGPYYKLSFDLLYRYEGWDVQILNRGSFWLDYEGYYNAIPKRKPFIDAEGRPFIGLLNDFGEAINKDSDTYRGIYYDGGDQPTFQRIRVRREVDFNRIGIL